MPETFTCSRDRFTTLFSIAIVVLIVTVSAISYIPLAKSGLVLPATGILLANLTIIVGVMLYLPLRYEVTADAVTVKRLGPDVVIPAGDIVRVTHDDGASLRGSIRLGANGGLGGYVGLFTNKTLGRYRAYMTRKDRVVLLETAQTIFVLSPDDPGRFVDALKTPGTD